VTIGVGVGVQAYEWRAAAELADRHRAALVEAVCDAHAAGMSEYALAKAAGVTRNTIRAWLGKGRPHE
jgi:transposase